MAVVDNGISVDFEEVTEPQKSPIERWTEDGFFATRILQCAWSDRITLAAELLTQYSVSAGGFAFTYGAQYPHSNGSLARRITSIEPFGKSNGDGSGNATWPLARLTVEYEPSIFDPNAPSASGENEVVYEEELNIAAEFLTLPNDGIFWDTAGTAPVKDIELPGFLVRMAEWTANFKTTNSLPLSLYSFINSVNDGAITSNTLGITFAAETLLYQGPRIVHQKLSDASDIYDVTLRFTARQGGWNKFYRSALVAPVAIYDDSSPGTVFKPYEPKDFTTIYVA